MTSFTPGPWSTCQKGDCSCGMVGSEHHPICTVESGEWGDMWPAIRVEPGIGGKAEAYMERSTYGTIEKETAKANARLIAAAPDLYESGEKLCNEIAAIIGICELRPLVGNTNFQVLVERWENLKAAIARVEGE